MELSNINFLALIFGSSFALILLMDFGLAVILQGHVSSDITACSVAIYVFLIGLFFIATLIGINMLYQRKSFKLWAIDAGVPDRIPYHDRGDTGGMEVTIM